ncbi:McrB family protein [Paenibacillus gansuensis]|uniref:McrB family protein n=1 Tax=Paenibacillus gansuensis TaxID=306542 RepID=A0ABW5PF30_9BACL
MAINSPIDIRDISNCILLGKLADPYDARIPGLGQTREAITENNIPGLINIYIQAISAEPKLLTNVIHKDPKDIYITFDNRNQAFLRSIKYYETENKIQHLYEHLENKLILFKPKIKERNNSSDLYHYNFDFVWVGDTLESDHYVPVPRVDRDLSSIRFESHLADLKPFRLLDYPNLMETPEFLVCDRYLYHIPHSDMLTSANIRTTYYCKMPDEVKKIQLPEDWNQRTKGIYRDLAFIPDVYAAELRDLFDSNGVSINRPVVIETSASSQVSAQPVIEEVINQEVAEVIQRASESGTNMNEYEFLNQLRYLADKGDLAYVEADLYNFHIALKTGFLTILGGMSGTGKTRLATLYANALGLKSNDDILIVPVSPAYTEPADILGYLNQQLGIYTESETGLVSFLNKAAQNEDRMFMVIFDEMNLGQVEHYFSPFISLLEMGEEDRYLTLFSENSICRDRSLPNRIKVGKNVLFVGTANFDETTKDFSKRLLDRANVIHLQKKEFREVKETTYIGEAPKWTKDFKIKSDVYRNQWTRSSNGIRSLLAEELDLFDKLNESISNIDAQTGVSFRIVMGISEYLDNIPTDDKGAPLLSRTRALDYQVKQRILTKIRGHREQIESLIGTYDFHKGTYQEGDLVSMFRDEEWDFEFSSKYLTQKAKELTRNGYVL